MQERDVRCDGETKKALMKLLSCCCDDKMDEHDANGEADYPQVQAHRQALFFRLDTIRFLHDSYWAPVHAQTV